MSPLLNEKANWDSLWSSGFTYGPIESWSTDLFLAIGQLLKDTSHPKILSAGCGRGLIDYWLIQVFGYHVTFLDYSKQCIQNLQKNLRSLNRSSYALSQSSIFHIPFPDNSFDLVWNEGVLEHFSKEEFSQSVSEMCRVSRKYVLIDVPNANCKPYVLAKEWLEEHKLWAYGYELPRKTLRPDFRKHHLRVLQETAIGNLQTIKNYIAMVPEKNRKEITRKLHKKDYTVFPHLLTIGEIKKVM